MYALFLALVLLGPAQCSCGPDCQCVPGASCGCLPGYATTDLPSLAVCQARAAREHRLLVCWVGQRSPAGETALPEALHCYTRAIDLRQGPGTVLIDYRTSAPSGCTWWAGVGAPVDEIRREAGLATSEPVTPRGYFTVPPWMMQGGDCGPGGCAGGGCAGGYPWVDGWDNRAIMGGGRAAGGCAGGSCGMGGGRGRRR